MKRIIPNVIFKARVKDESIKGKKSYRWQDFSTDDYFKKKKVILFSLPGAFTPTCSTYQLPMFEKLYEKFMKNGIDEIYCLSVNDAFVMNAWARSKKLKNVKVIPDGSGEFTRLMGMLVKKDNLGFGMRSWRYAAYVDNCIIKKMWIEEGMSDNSIGDTYGISSPENLLKYFKNKQPNIKLKRIYNGTKSN